MKIAIIGNGFTGATLPLAKYLCLNGHNVNCFYIVKFGSKSIESLDFDKPIPFCLHPQSLIKSNTIYLYLTNSIDIKLLGVFRRRPKLERYVLGNSISFINKFLIKKYFRYIKREGYDFVIIIVHTELELLICDLLSKYSIPFIIDFHEVLVSHSLIPSIKPLVLESLNFTSPFIVHSRKTQLDLQMLIHKELNNNIKVIHFGQFESYGSYGEGKDVNVGSDYYLYLGYIFPHKGLKYLYEAIHISPELQKEHFVIAGSGYDSILPQMKKERYFSIINRYIENSELVALVKGAKALVCPYISGSQSGIVQTAMFFKKPVVATKVAAFEEVLIDGINGFLAEPADAFSLAQALLRARFPKDMRCSIPDDYDWNIITSQYLELIQCKKTINRKNENR